MIQVAYLHIMLQQMMITTQSQHNYMYAKLQQAINIFSQNFLDFEKLIYHDLEK